MREAHTGSAGLHLAIQTVREVALRAGHHDLAARLQTLWDAPERAPMLEVDVLAGEVRRDGETVALSRGERTLLFALALHRRFCTRDELIEMLYPHLDHSVASTQLKVYVHRVRRRLGDKETILFQSGSYRLGARVACDLWQVEADIAQAMKSHGALDPSLRDRLDSIRIRLARRNVACAEDREWFENLERRLEALSFDVSLRLGEAAITSGDVQSALALTREAFELDPCDERAAELAIRSHLASGDRPCAVRQLRRYERALRDEFNVTPSPELRSLVN